ncbi:hypothetical protein TcYC6_0008110 [Trypanosoma cruzi]|nr:hypothetical protein TcYC6_0008110 [Trypanosoma cruzi]
MEQAEIAAEAARKAHTLPRPEKAWFEPNSSKKRGIKSGLTPWLLCASGSPHKILGASPQTGEIFAVWRRRTLILWNRLCSALILDRVCALPRQQANLLVRHFLRVSRATSPYTAAAARRTLLNPGDWEMDRTFPPYELDVNIRDSSLGSAAGPDDMLNEFLHRLGPVACGTPRTMIHNSFANGSLPGSRNTVDTIPIPKPWKDPCRPVSYRPITLLFVLLKLTERMIHRRLSALLPHHPRQFRICTFAFNIGRGDTCHR